MGEKVRIHHECKGRIENQPEDHHLESQVMTVIARDIFSISSLHKL